MIEEGLFSLVSPFSPDLFHVQKRLRNICGLAVRHLDVSDERLNMQIPFNLGFTFSCIDDHDKEPFFISKLIENSANPLWEELEFDHSVQSKNELNVHQVSVQVFSWANSRMRRLLHWEIDLRALACIGDSLDTIEMDFASNTVMFLLKSGVYICPADIPLTALQFVRPPARTLRKASSMYSLRQLLKLEKDLADVRRRRLKAQLAVDDAVRLTAERVSVFRQTERIESRLTSLQSSLKDCKMINASLKQFTVDLENNNQLVSSTLEAEQAGFTLDNEDLNRLKDKLSESRAMLTRAASELRKRRLEMISSTCLIYPIHRSASGRIFICGVWLPSVDQHANCDDITLSAGLGYAAHLMILLSKILSIPLRYPVRFQCSMSSIQDPTSPKLLEREREFPLQCIKVRDRARFHVGVFLFNLNIGQLRMQFGLNTSGAELKKTIENIQNLLIEKLGMISPLNSSPLPVSTIKPALVESTPDASMTRNSPLNEMNGEENGFIDENRQPTSLSQAPDAQDFRRTKTQASSTSAVFIPESSKVVDVLP